MPHSHRIRRQIAWWLGALVLIQSAYAQIDLVWCSEQVSTSPRLEFSFNGNCRAQAVQLCCTAATPVGLSTASWHAVSDHCQNCIDEIAGRTWQPLRGARSPLAHPTPGCLFTLAAETLIMPAAADNAAQGYTEANPPPDLTLLTAAGTVLLV